MLLITLILNSPAIQTRSIANFFGPSLRNNPILASAAVKPSPVAEKPCQHLTGIKYTEYTRRTQTRSLGGISPSFRAKAIRKLFAYKPFPPVGRRVELDEEDSDIEMEVELGDDEVVVKVEVPENGNKELLASKWTADEMARHDKHMKAFARWEVDYAGGSVRSTQCSGKTSHISGICAACRKLEDDESLKRAIRGVCVFFQIRL